MNFVNPEMSGRKIKAWVMVVAEKIGSRRVILFVGISLGSLAIEVSKFQQVIDKREDLGSFIFTLTGIISTILIAILVLRLIRKSLSED